jgi:hypothetical protein
MYICKINHLVRVQNKLRCASIYTYILDALHAKHNYNGCKGEILEMLRA